MGEISLKKIMHTIEFALTIIIIKSIQKYNILTPKVQGVK